MTRNLRIALFTVLGALLPWTLLSQQSSAAEFWQHDFQKAMAEAKSSGKPLLLHFHADWCQPCQTMERTVLNTDGVKRRLKDSVIGVKIDVEEHRTFAKGLGVELLPTDLFMSPDGKKLSLHEGMTSESTYLQRIDSVAKQFPAEVLADQKSETTESNKKSFVLTVEDDLGLAGFCPVTLVEDQEWIAGSEEFVAQHAGMTYQFQTKTALRKFRKSPESFVPGFVGCDPVELHENRDAIQGDIQFGAFYRDRFYMLVSEANQKKFLDNPARYTSPEYEIRVEQIRQMAEKSAAFGPTRR